MKICVDENIPLVTVLELKNLQHDVLDIRKTPDRGMPDDLLWELVTSEGRLMITTDKGFVQHRSELHHGLLIVRLRQPNEQKIHDRVMRAIDQFREDEWRGLTVVMRDTVQSFSRTS
jgi:predicted nuclease of predicted toxin-antitoxin system